MSDHFGKDTPKLGFGLMRLPKRGVVIDVEKTKVMTDKFLEAGFTYFDTAFVYPGSETAAGKALVARHPRESFTLATKLNVSVAPSEKAARKQFAASLARTGAGYFDYYLLHAIQENNHAKYDRFRIWDFAKEQKEKGLIKHIGFSFHAGPELLNQLLVSHPEVDFVQLQINYADWENPKVQSRANYEVARAHGKGIVVMEPVKGGQLADPPEAVKKLFRDHAPDASPASWAIRFAASLDGIITVLSGMSNVAQMEDNISFMKDFKPLNGEEQAVIRQAQCLLDDSSVIPCTACHYCTEGCPKQIPIPEIFAAANKQLGGGQPAEARADYMRSAAAGHRASDCVKCGQCEQSCPQHLSIREQLEKCAALLEETDRTDSAADPQ